MSSFLRSTTALSRLPLLIGSLAALAATAAGIAPAQAGQLPASAFQTYNAANAASIQPGPFALYTVPVNSLHPTQLDVGSFEVGKKAAGFDLTAASALSASLLTDIEPVVIGPGGQLYLTDGHHTFLALTQSVFGASNPTVYVDVIANYANLTTAQFWAAMQAANFVLPLADGVVETIDPLTGAPLPAQLAGMGSDVYRGLEYGILKNKSSVLFPNASNLTGAAGSAIPGLDKTAAFYSDFIWAYAYRNANGGLGLPYLSPGDIALATKWNLNPASTTTLPGLGAMTVAQLPGFILPTGGSISISGTIGDATLANGTLDGTATGSFTQSGGNNASFAGMRGLTLGSVTIGTNAPGFIMQLGADNGATVTLTGNNTWTGGTTILAGTLVVGSDAALGAAAPANPTVSPDAIAASVRAANGIVFDSLSEGNGTLRFGTTSGAYTSGSPFVTNRPIAVDGEVANLDLNGNVVTLTGPIASLGGGGTGIGNATGESDLTVMDSASHSPGVLILPASVSNPYFYGNWIINSGTLQVSSDASLGNTTGASYTIGQLQLDGGILQAGASFNSVRSLFLTSGSTIDANGYTMGFAGALTDTQRTLTVTNSATGTSGQVGFGAFDIGATASLALTGGSTGTSTNVTVSLGSGFVRQGNAAVLLQPDLGVLGTAEKVVQTSAPTLTNGIAAPWIVLDSSASNNPYDFVTYGGNGYVAATYTGSSVATSAATDVVKQAANATLTGNAQAYALNVQKSVTVTVGAGHTLTLGDGSNPAGIILQGGSGGLSGGTLAFGGSEAVFFVAGSNTISSQITGSGGLTLNGSGTLTLATASTETGSIVINSGTLALSVANAFPNVTTALTLDNVKSHPAAAVLSMSASQSFAAIDSTGNNSSITLSNGAALTIGNTTSNLDSTISSAITESGSAVAGALTFNGTGLADLTGISKGKLNLVNGSTVIVNGGDLRIAANTFKNPNAIVLNGGELQFAQNGGGVFANSVSGTGTLHLIGGTLQLTSTSNSYTGGTVVEYGSTLDVTTANLPAGNPNITAAGGTVLFDQATSGTYTGVISDGREMGTGPMLAGTLIKDDSSGGNTGNVTLGQAQAYSGATYVEAGTLTLGAVNAIASSSGVILGRVGGGSTAVLALGADNRIAALADNPGNTAQPSTNTVQLNGHTLTIAPAAGVSSTFLGTINGTGGVLTLAGAGTQVLDGQSNIGITTVQSGTLAIGDAGSPGASMTGAVSVGTGGALAGTGSIIGTLANAGALLPGTAASPGTLAVTGAFAQASGGTLDVVITPAGQSSRLAVSGSAALAGAVALVPEGTGFLAGTRYTLVTAGGGVTGSFASASPSFTWLIPTLSYDSTDAYVTLAQRNPAEYAATPNQAATGNALNALFATGTATQQQTAFDQSSVAQSRGELDRLSGQSYTGFQGAALGAGSAFLGQIGNELGLVRLGGGGMGAQAAGLSGRRVQLAASALTPGMIPAMSAPHWSVWAEGFGQSSAVPGNANAGQLNSTLAGTVVGADYQVTPQLLLGVAAGFAADDFSVNGSGAWGHTDNALVALYGAYGFGQAYVNATLGYAHATGTMTRDVSLIGLAGRAQGSIAGNQALGRVEAGYDLKLTGGVTATPFASLQFGTYAQDAMTESLGGALALHVHSMSADSVASVLGARVGTSLPVGRVTVSLQATLGWAHEYASTARSMTANFVGAPTAPFTVAGAEAGRDHAIVGFGLGSMVARNTSLFVRYDGAVNGSDNTHVVSGGVKLVW